MAYSKSKEHEERMARIDKQWAELDKRIEQSQAEMQWVLKHRFKIWLGFVLFWIVVFWVI